jgi:hypothetical protein
MALRLRKVELLAKELSKDVNDAINMLANKGIKVVDGYYDQFLFDAILKEPAIRSQQRLEWGLSHRLGIGAVKSLLDPLGLRITVHDCKRAQYLMLKKGTEHSYVKWQYANSSGVKTRTCLFQTLGFVDDEKQDHYLFVCFDGPFGWVLSRKQLISTWNTLRADGEVTSFSIPKKYAEHAGGALQIRFNIDTSKYELKNTKQLGFSS